VPCSEHDTVPTVSSARLASPARFGIGWLLIALAAIVAALGCQNYQDQLQRGQGYYEQNQYEHALALFRHLEKDQDSLSPSDRVRYYYLRGMTDFRLQYNADARYWLGLSRAGEKKAQGALAADELQRLEKSLDELDTELHGGQPKAAMQPAVAAPTGPRCQWSSECSSGLICQDGSCVSIQ